MERRSKIIIICVVAAVVVAVFFLVQTPTEQKDKCGDSVCSIQESWETCPIDCAKPAPTNPVEVKIAEVTKECKDDVGFLNKTECVDRRLFIEAVIKLDLAYCERISSLENRGLCLVQVISKMSFENGPNECNRLTSDAKIICLDAYYDKTATEKNNVEYCYNISNVDSLNSCHDRFVYNKAVEGGNCSMLNLGRKKSWCLYDLAKERGDRTLCQEIPAEDIKKNCLESVGGANG